MIEKSRTSSEIPAEGVVLGIDYGRVRVGLARSDGAQVTSVAIGFIRRTSDQQVAQAVQAIVRSEAAVAVIIGEPLHSDGGAGANSGGLMPLLRPCSKPACRCQSCAGTSGFRPRRRQAGCCGAARKKARSMPRQPELSWNAGFNVGLVDVAPPSLRQGPWRW